MTCNFRVGQKVVCVDDSDPVGSAGWHARKGTKFGLSHGKVYTIEGIYEAPGFYNGKLENSVCLSLAELKKPPPPIHPWADGFNAKRFRPVVQRKTDISVFKALLTPSKEKVETP